MRLYHAGLSVIEYPDVTRGRSNADFGRGFYLTTEREFALGWSRWRDGSKVRINAYELDVEGLVVHEFERDVAWFDYIFSNRNGAADTLSADVVMGPIANDTIFDTLGVITSGLLTPEQSLALLMVGPTYRQVALKTERAASRLTWISAETPDAAELEGVRAAIAEAERSYLKEFNAKLGEIM